MLQRHKSRHCTANTNARIYDKRFRVFSRDDATNLHQITIIIWCLGRKRNHLSINNPRKNGTTISSWLSWLSFSYKLVKMLSLCVDVCLGVNQGGTNCNRCTQILVILHTLTYTNEPWSHAKTRSVWPTLRFKIHRRNKVGVNRYFQAISASQPWDACY